MVHSIRFKIIAGFLAVSILVGGVSLFAGGELLYSGVIRETKNQLQLALDAAEVVYDAHVQSVRLTLDITTLGEGFRQSFLNRDIGDLKGRLNRMAHHAKLDFAGICGAEGQTLCRLGLAEIPAQKFYFLDGIHSTGSLPYVTIFLDTVRIATNMTGSDGKRAVVRRALGKEAANG